MLRLILLVAAGLLFWTSPLARVMGVDLLRSTADLLEPEDADKERQKIQETLDQLIDRLPVSYTHLTLPTIA